MDDRRFDDLTKLVGRRASRRTVIRAAIAGAIASVFGGGIAEAALSPIKTRPRLCIQPGQPCAKPGTDPSRDCCYKCNSTTHKCCEDIGYQCTTDTNCCVKLVNGVNVQPICRDPQAAGTDRRKACFLPGTLTPGAQCLQGTDCSSGNCVNGVCSACAVGTTTCGANCCTTAQCQVCIGGQCRSKCGPCQSCNGQGVCVPICNSCQKCVNNTCVAKCSAALCQTCDPATGVCSTCNGDKCKRCVNGQCVDKCTKCQTCDVATGVCTPKTCPNCLTCNPTTGECTTPKACGPCQSCDPVDGICTSTCNPCQRCLNGVCIGTTCPICQTCDPAFGTCQPIDCGPCEACSRTTGSCETTCDNCEVCDEYTDTCVSKCPEPCSPCDPYTGLCDEIVCDGPCETCQDGACVGCDADQCQQCNLASETCESTCGPCTTCDGSGTCVALCGDCEICANGQCRPLCGPCMTCNADEAGAFCEPAVCAGDCQTCNPDSGQCEACGENTCTSCDDLTNQCVFDCGDCATCIEGECVSCTNLPCSQCGAAPGQCDSFCSDPCFSCDVNTNECMNPACDDLCDTCFGIVGGVATCLDRATVGDCVHCTDGVVISCENCEFCGSDGCTSCIGLPCWTCEAGECSNACGTCQFCTDDGVCVDYTCGPDQICDQFGGCIDACAVTSDCGDCRTCSEGRCVDCLYCIDGVCVTTVPSEARQLDQTAPTPRVYQFGTDFQSVNHSGVGDITATVQAVDVVLPPAPVPNSNTSGCEASDFAGFIAGNIALIQRGTCTFRQKVLNAQAAGAGGVIIFNEGQPGRTDPIFVSVGVPGITIPVVFTSFAVGNELESSAGTVVHMVVAPVV